MIRHLTPKDAIDLVDAGFSFDRRVFNQKLNLRFLQAINLLPRSTKLVAYHVKQKRAVGFLCLEEDSASLYSIKFVFTNPRFRKRGVATKLLDFAVLLAKERGAKKVHLDVAHGNNRVVQLYERIGFKIVGHTMMGQGYISKFPRLRIVRLIMMGRGYISKFVVKKKGRLNALQTRSKRNKELLFSIYQRCVDQKWKDFFETNTGSFMDGYLQSWRSFVFRDVFVSDQFDSFALVFNRPFFSDVSVEVYSATGAINPSLLGELTKILYERGLAYINIKLINISDNKFSFWLKEQGLESMQFVTMGKIL